MQKARVYEQQVVIPTYRTGAPDGSPLFIEKRAYQGSTGKVYPLPVIEKLSDEKTDVTYRAVILENEYLYVMVLPELGGRIQRALDKTNGYDFVYYNHVIKPALVGLAGPWISGGIEFNWPQHHRPSTFMPVNYTCQEHEDGSASVVVGETDRMYGTKGNATITLYPGKAYIEISGRLFNPTDHAQTFLWWANPAVAVNEHTFSVFPPDVNAVMDHGKRAVSTFPIATGEYYKADYSAGVDISRYKNIRVPTSYMAAHSDFDFVGNFDEGMDAGLLHVADHHISPGKKQWTWGCGDFGRTWDKNLTDEDGPYIELMTGVFCDNQPDFTWLMPHEEKSFVQYFMPYKTVGRVSNATKDAVIGVEQQEAAASMKLKVYTTGVFLKATITVTEAGREIYRKTIDLTPDEAFTDDVASAQDYCVTVKDHAGRTLCVCQKYVQSLQPLPEPAEVLRAPQDIGSLEELWLAGQHLEQYRHATFLPEDYYLEGLRRDPRDSRLNLAYGQLLLRRTEAAKSIPYFQAALRRLTWRNPNPATGEASYGLGVAFEILGRLDEAQDAFYKAVWSADVAVAAWYHLACISARRGQLADACAFAHESLQRNAHDVKTRAFLSALYARMGASEDACQALSKENIAIDPLHPLSVYFAFGKEKFADLFGDRLHDCLQSAFDLMQMGSYADALSLLSCCRETSPLLDHAKAYALLQTGDHNAALTAAIQGEQLPADGCFPNRTEERMALEVVIHLLESRGETAAIAHCALGHLLYDKRLHKEAIAHWEAAVRVRPDLALAHRNLSIAHFNHGDRSQAEKYIATACRLAPENSRYLLEQDQLLKRLECPATSRLALLEDKKDILVDRYALMLSYITLLNVVGRHKDALALLEHYTFHVWEGGEGKIAAEYKIALLSLAERALSQGDDISLHKAFSYAERSLTYPDNLGEGKLDNVPDNQAYYLMGCACRAMGDEAQAQRYFTRAAEGSQMPESVRYYNDQPSDYIYYQGLALHALGLDDKAKKSFHQLIIFGERHQFDKVGYDFFAVSMPELEVYEDDIQKRSDEYCRRLAALGKRGLRLMDDEQERRRNT